MLNATGSEALVLFLLTAWSFTVRATAFFSRNFAYFFYDDTQLVRHNIDEMHYIINQHDLIKAISVIPVYHVWGVRRRNRYVFETYHNGTQSLYNSFIGWERTTPKKASYLEKLQMFIFIKANFKFWMLIRLFLQKKDSKISGDKLIECKEKSMLIPETASGMIWVFFLGNRLK